MNLVAASGGSGEPGGLDILLPPLYEIFWSAVVFLLIWLVLGKALPKLYKTIDSRNEEIEQGLMAGEKAQEDAALAERERKDVLRQANEQAREIREKASMDAQRIVAQAREQAQEEANRIADNSERQLLADRQAAELSLRQDVGGLATDLAQKIIGEQLKDSDLSARVIDRFMDDLEADLDSVGAKS